MGNEGAHSGPNCIVLVSRAESFLDLRDDADQAACGSYDRLTPRGREQARIAGRYLLDTVGRFDACFFPPCNRAKEMVSIMFPPEYGGTLREDLRLAEVFPADAPDPNTRARAEDFLGTLCGECAEQDVCVFDHAAWRVAFLGILLRMSLEDARRRFRVEDMHPASFTILQQQSAQGQYDIFLENAWHPALRTL